MAPLPAGADGPPIGDAPAADAAPFDDLAQLGGALPDLGVLAPELSKPLGAEDSLNAGEADQRAAGDIRSLAVSSSTWPVAAIIATVALALLATFLLRASLFRALVRRRTQRTDDALSEEEWAEPVDEPAALAPPVITVTSQVPSGQGWLPRAGRTRRTTTSSTNAR